MNRGALGGSGQRRPRRRRSTRLLRRAMLLGVAALPLAKGGMPCPARVTLCAALLGMFAWLLWQRPALLMRARGNPMVWATSLAFGATLLQLLPVPVVVLRLLAPGAAAVRHVWGDATWATLSLDVPATCMEAVTLGAYALAAALAVALFRDSTRQRELLLSVCMGGAATVCVGLLGMLVDDATSSSLLGVAGTGFSGTFVNPNHAAAYLGFASFIALGRAFDEWRTWRASLFLVGVACGACVILSLSRGGVIIYLGAFALISLVLAVRHGREARGRGVLAGLAAILLVAATLAYSDVVHELWTLSNANGLDKTQLWRAALPVMRDFPVLGMGRGVFVVASPRYLANPVHLATFTHLENEWLQTLVDFGPLLGLFLIGLVVKAAWPLVREMPTSSTAAGLGAAVLFVGAQNLVDFSLQCPALALPLVLVLACRSHIPMAAGDEAPAGPTGRVLWSAWGAVAVVACAASGGALLHTPELDTMKVAQISQHRTLTPRQRDTLLRARMAWHPADYVMPMVASQNALTAGATLEARRWVGVAMRLAPDWAEPYHVAGRVAVAERRYDDAVTAYGLACQLRPGDTATVAAEVLAVTNKPELVVRLGDVAPAARAVLAEFLLTTAPNSALQLLQRPVAGVVPGLVARLRAQAYLALRDFASATTWARVAQGEAPQNAMLYTLEADAARGAQDVDGALAALRRGLEQTGDVDRLIPPAAILLMDAGRFEESRVWAKMLLERSQRSTPTAHRLMGKAWQRQGKLQEALREYEKCRSSASGELSVRLDIANLKEAAGDLRGAVQELELAQQVVARPAEVEPVLARLRDKLRAQTDAIMRERVQDRAVVF